MTIHHVLTLEENKNHSSALQKRIFSGESPELFVFLSHFYAVKGLEEVSENILI